MTLVDTHTHLYLKEFENDLQQVVERARNAGVARFCLPAIDSAVIADILRLETLYPGEMFPMMGLHPCSVKEHFLEELNIVAEYLSRRSFCAIGEIGLDFYWDTTYKDQQYEAFDKQMNLALQYQVPIVIHTRNAMRETIDAVKPYASKGLGGIFHCFGDSYEVAKEIVDMGFYLGIGGVVTYKKANLGESLKDIPLERMVLETDAPYLSPVPYRGKRNESSYLVNIAQYLSQIKNVPIEKVAEVTTANAEKIFWW